MKNFINFLKITIATAIVGVAVFNASIATNVDKSSGLTLAGVEALSQIEVTITCTGWGSSSPTQRCWTQDCHNVWTLFGPVSVTHCPDFNGQTLIICYDYEPCWW